MILISRSLHSLFPVNEKLHAAPVNRTIPKREILAVILISMLKEKDYQISIPQYYFLSNFSTVFTNISLYLNISSIPLISYLISFLFSSKTTSNFFVFKYKRQIVFLLLSSSKMAKYD